MSKKSTKVLSGALATSLMMGAMPVFAADTTAPDYDALYAAALTAAQKAETDKTQVAVTAARTAIKPLLDAYKNGETWLESMVGTLSSMVDAVQQNLFNEFYDILYVNGVLKPTLTQAQIDQARGYVDGFKTYEGNTEYITSWSSAVDTFQQAKYDVAFAAVQKAEKSGLKADVDAAQVLLTEIATSKVESVKAWAKTVQAQLDAVVVGEIEVKEVSAISKTGVVLNIKALTEAKTDVTVTVKDNNGNIVEVKAVSVLDVGETVATFTFKTALTTEPTGTWTVNGVSFDASAQAAVKKVNAAANQVELLSALKSTYFTGVVDAKITAYFAEMNPNIYDTVADVQKAIDKVNNSVVSTKLISDIVDAMDANNEVELLALISDASFVRVNADFITEYMNAFNTSTPIAIGSTIAQVQAKIDAVNLAAAVSAVEAADTTVATALTASALADAQDLVSVLPEKEVAEKAEKVELQGRIDKANAYAKVKAATTQASLLSALKAPVLKLQNIDDTLAKYYKQLFDATEKALITNVAYNIQTGIVDAGKVAAIGDLNTKISKVTAETTIVDVKALLTELKRLDGTTFVAKINDSLLVDYKAALVAVAADSRNETSEIQGIISGVNTNTIELAKVKNYTGSDSNELLLLLQDKKLALKNVVAENKSAYLNDLTLITGEATTVADLQKAINVVNAVVDANAATTAEQMRVALTAHSANLSTPYSAYLNLVSQAKLEVANIALKAKVVNFADSAALEAALNTASTGAMATFNSILTAVNGVKADSDITDIDKALQKVGYKAYNDLDLVTRLSVAEAFRNKMPVDKDGVALTLTYKTLADIIADIDEVL